MTTHQHNTRQEKIGTVPKPVYQRNSCWKTAFKVILERKPMFGLADHMFFFVFQSRTEETSLILKKGEEVMIGHEADLYEVDTAANDEIQSMGSKGTGRSKRGEVKVG